METLRTAAGIAGFCLFAAGIVWMNLRYWSTLRAMSPAERAAYLEDERHEMAIW